MYLRWVSGEIRRSFSQKTYEDGICLYPGYVNSPAKLNAEWLGISLTIPTALLNSTSENAAWATNSTPTIRMNPPCSIEFKEACQYGVQPDQHMSKRSGTTDKQEKNKGLILPCLSLPTLAAGLLAHQAPNIP